MRRSDGREWKVGLLIVIALVLFGLGIFLIGEESNLFTSKNRYVIYFPTVSGLHQGNPVQLNGVEVGTVQEIVLPTAAEATEIKVTIDVDQRYSARIRQDSMARIKTLGLLGDKYVEVTSGSTDAEPIPPGGVIPAAPPTNVDKLIASGEDVMDNVVQISVDLRDILRRMERGEGLLGELTTQSETGERVTDAIVETMETVRRVAQKVEGGEGPLPRLIQDRELADRMASSVDRLDRILARVEEGDGLLPALLDDPKTREDFQATLAQLRSTAEDLSKVSADLQRGDGLLPMLIEDEEFGTEVKREVETILERIDELTRKLNEGEGTASRLINDPSVYQAVNDVIIGVEESKLLSWLIRNRQKKGIEKRYEEALEQQEQERTTGDGEGAEGDAR